MAYTTRTTVVAAFRNSSDAQAAAQDLETAGVRRSDIYLESSAGSTAETYESRTTKHEGGITGWFKSLFEEDDAVSEHAPYEKALNEGSYLLSVDAQENQLGSIETILNRHSPLNVHSEDSGTSSEAAYAAKPVTTPATSAAKTADTSAAIPVVEEELQVGKRQVLKGGVRVYSRVVETPVEESVDLREEHVRVDRRPVDRAATAADFAGEQVIEVTEMAEEAVVGKQARIVEEIHVGKDVTERTETIRDTVRHTEVQVDEIPGAATTGYSGSSAYDDTYFRKDFQTRYGSTGATYDTYSPAYKYGFEAASDPRYKGKSYSAIESDLKSDYGSKYPGGTWEKMKDAVQSGWNKVTTKV